MFRMQQANRPMDAMRPDTCCGHRSGSRRRLSEAAPVSYWV